MVSSWHANYHRCCRPDGRAEASALTAGVELDARVVDGRLEVMVPSRVRTEEGPHGLRFAADTETRLSAEEVREVMERSRR
jgi:hypothetical protein